MSRWRRLFTLLVQVAGLAGTGWIVWYSSVAPRLQHGSLDEILGGAFRYTAFACLWSLLLTLGLYLALRPRDPRTGLGTALRAAQTAVWFAPASLMLAQLSPAVVVPALALIVGITQLLYAQWIAIRPAHPLPQIDDGPFPLLPSPSPLRSLAPEFLTAAALQSGIAAMMGGYALLAVLLFGLVAGMLTLLLLSGGVLPVHPAQSLPRAAFGVLLTLILAAGVTSVHVVYMQLRHGAAAGGDQDTEQDRGPVESARDLVREFMRKLTMPDPPDAWKGEADRRLYRTGETGVDLNDKIFPGVVLWPEVKPYTVIVAPEPSWTRTSIAVAAAKPYSIPFSGEYWMFKPPATQPPRGAYSEKGSPVQLSFRTTDHRTLAMEAHQRLDHPVDTHCCAAIRIAISNADPYPGTVALELLLVQNDAHGRRFESLGRNRVKVWPELTPAGRLPVPSLLEFPIPDTGSVTQFNELVVILHRDLVRGDKSARIAIERFILVPRGI